MSRFMTRLGRGLLGLALAGAVLTAAPAAAQTPAQIQAAVDAAYAKYKNNNDGAVADYIPALAKVDPKVFGIAVVTADGKVYTAGDLTTQVSIQSISKVYTMALVMNQQSPDVILNTIGADATGLRFNSIISVEYSFKALGGSRLESAAEMNALVNPGAITATSMVQGKSPTTTSGATSSASTTPPRAGNSRCWTTSISPRPRPTSATRPSAC